MRRLLTETQTIVRDLKALTPRVLKVIAKYARYERLEQQLAAKPRSKPR